jgi:hypothetical protein
MYCGLRIWFRQVRDERAVDLSRSSVGSASGIDFDTGLHRTNQKIVLNVGSVLDPS